MKNKTFTTWLTLLLGPFGLHRLYLFGPKDLLFWLLPVPTFAGLYGFERVQNFGLDDVLSWWLLPVFGVTLAATCLQAIVFGLMTCDAWNLRYNPTADPQHPSGHTHWLTVFAIIISLMVGTAALLSALAYGFQRYFESTTLAL